MKLSLLLKAIRKTLQGKDVEIDFITDDSRLLKPNSLFVCHHGAEAFLPAAKKSGAAAVIAAEAFDDGCIAAEDTRKAYAALCRAFFGYADRQLRLIAVTGTNGKTSVATMLSHILTLNGVATKLLSTVTNAAPNGCGLTTPDCFSLHRALRKAADDGKTVCVLEASSQGLQEQRLEGLRFFAGIFTNLTRDHLDVHGTFENYKQAKQMLFSACDTAILNYDDPAWHDMAAVCSGSILTYSAHSNEADFTAKDVRFAEDQINYALVCDALIHRVRLYLQGEFNVENSMAAIIAAMVCGLPLEKCAPALQSFSPVPGRMERLALDTPFQVVLDYAHTPDSLKRVLRALRRFCKGRLILVFGCGGNRDKGKRPEMGRVAAAFADLVVLTDDNPRTEDSSAILDDILSGMTDSKTPVFLQADRRSAIAFALKTAQAGDTVLLAGKGHEATQLVQNERRSFSERDIVKEILETTK